MISTFTYQDNKSKKKSVAGIALSAKIWTFYIHKMEYQIGKQFNNSIRKISFFVYFQERENNETFCICFKWGEEDEGKRWCGQTQLMYNVIIFRNVT